MYAGIKAVRPGAYIGDIDNTVFNHAYKHGYSVVHEYGDHGTGQTMWEDPYFLILANQVSV